MSKLQNTSTIKVQGYPIEKIIDSLAHELGVTKEHGKRIKNLLAAFAIEIKRASIEGEW